MANLSGGTGSVTYSGGNFYNNGVLIVSPSSYTWAQFTDAGFDLSVARHVHITDKHSSIISYGGSLWYVDPAAIAGYKRQLVSGPITCTWATRLNAATYPGVRHYITDIGVHGSDWVSNGTRHILYGDRPCILKTATDLGIASSITEVITTSVPIITDATKSCWQNGDRLRIFTQFDKSGTANQLSRKIRMGSVNTTSATQLNVATPSTASIAIGERIEIKRLSATSVRVVGQASGSFQVAGNSTTGWESDKTGLDNIDTSANYYLNFGLALFGGALDTNVTHRDMICELITCGA